MNYTKKVVMTQITTMMWSFTQSQTTQCVKSNRPQEALPRTKLVFGTKLGDGISAELFQILKDDTVKVLNSICQQIWKTQHWSQYWKRSIFIPIPKKGNAKNIQTTIQLHSFHMLTRLYSKSFNQALAVHESRTSRCTFWVQKRQRNQRSNFQHSLDHKESKGISENLMPHWLH